MRGLVVPDVEEDFTADQVELYFDLAFVFAFAQLVAFLHHEHTLAGVARASLLFLMIWLTWSQFTWSTNAISSGARVVRALLIVATVAVMPMSATVATAYGSGGLLFAVSMVIIVIMANLATLSALPSDHNLRASYLRYALPVIASMVFFLAGGVLDGNSRIVAWLAGLAVFIYSTIRAGESEWIIRAGHFSERHGLIVIIALGEVIVAIGLPVVELLSEEIGIGMKTLAALVLAGIFAGLLFWSYFDRFSPGMEHRVEETTDARERGSLARDVYTYCHFLIVGGIILAAAGLEEITLHPDELLEPVWRWMLFIGLAAFLLGTVAAVNRSYRVWPKERLVAVVVIGLALAVAGGLDGLTILVGLDVILAVMLVAEHIRIER